MVNIDESENNEEDGAVRMIYALGNRSRRKFQGWGREERDEKHGHHHERQSLGSRAETGVVLLSL
jgi:hypothetical protein